MITVEQITKSYGPVRALKGISFSIQKGEIVGLLGPNGAGKSTTMKVLTCYLPADSGTANVAGFDVFEQSLEVRRRIGYLPENNPLYGEMGIVEFLQFVGGMRGMSGARRRARIGDVIDRCGLTRQVGKDIGQLSKGNRQRVGLAAALIHEPDVLILDEPTTGLDPNQVVEIRELIHELGKDHTVILSTHILSEVQATCNRAIIVADGKVVADGTVDELRARGEGIPQVVVRVKTTSAAEARKKLEAISQVSKVETLDADASAPRFKVIGKEAQADLPEAIFRAAVEAKLTLTELRPEGATLEEVFADLTR